MKHWGECVLTTTYLINRMPTKLLKGKTPYELLYGSILVYKHLRVFACLCSMPIAKQGRDKFQPRPRPCIFMGYPFFQKGYKIMDVENNKFHISRDVVFHDEVFPFTTRHQDKPMLQSIPTFYPGEESDAGGYKETSASSGQTDRTTYISSPL